MVKKFSLGGADWVVKEVDALDCMGLCDPHAHTIYIRSGQTSQAATLTFFHELVHAILFSIGETEHSEKFVEAFGLMLMQFNKTVKS